MTGVGLFFILFQPVSLIARGGRGTLGLSGNTCRKEWIPRSGMGAYHFKDTLQSRQVKSRADVLDRPKHQFKIPGKV